MAAPNSDNTVLISGWPLGINNKASQTESVLSREADPRFVQYSQALRKATNVDITEKGKVRKRSGYTKLTGGFTHSLWSDPTLHHAFCVVDGNLSRVDRGGVVEHIAPVNAYRRMVFATVNDVVYFSNGEEMGRIDGHKVKNWGMPAPQKPVVNVVENGSLDSGTYIVKLTYLDTDGEEYGASKEERITVDKQGIVVSVQGLWPDEADQVAVYVSKPDESELYRVTTVSTPVDVPIPKDLIGIGKRLDTDFCEPPKPPTLIEFFSGRLYCARGVTISFTEPLRYSLTKPSQGIFQYSSPVTLLQSVEDGLFVGTESGTYFLQGTNPYEMAQRKVSADAPVIGTSSVVPASVLSGDEGTPVWWTKDSGMVAGKAGGSLDYLTHDRYSTPRYSVGATMYKEQHGVHQVVSSMRGGDDITLGAQDSVVAEIRSKNVVLNR